MFVSLIPGQSCIIITADRAPSPSWLRIYGRPAPTFSGDTTPRHRRGSEDGRKEKTHKALACQTYVRRGHRVRRLLQRPGSTRPLCPYRPGRGSAQDSGRARRGPLTRSELGLCGQQRCRSPNGLRHDRAGAIARTVTAQVTGLHLPGALALALAWKCALE